MFGLEQKNNIIKMKLLKLKKTKEKKKNRNFKIDLKERNDNY